jgi:RimJ/RimL family protein N-acetyltransferase
MIESERLSLRRLNAGDAEFILELLNDPSFIQNIGDRGVRTVADACRYIANGPVASYEKFGFGLYLVQIKESGVPIGICGLLKRESLEDVDVGFAFLPAFRQKGYAFESAAAVMRYGRDVLRLNRIVAITSPENEGSIRVLEKLGMRFEKIVNLPGHGRESKLFG